MQDFKASLAPGFRTTEESVEYSSSNELAQAFTAESLGPDLSLTVSVPLRELEQKLGWDAVRPIVLSSSPSPTDSSHIKLTQQECEPEGKHWTGRKLVALEEIESINALLELLPEDRAIRLVDVSIGRWDTEAVIYFDVESADVK